MIRRVRFRFRVWLCAHDLHNWIPLDRWYERCHRCALLRSRA